MPQNDEAPADSAAPETASPDVAPKARRPLRAPPAYGRLLPHALLPRLIAEHVAMRGDGVQMRLVAAWAGLSPTDLGQPFRSPVQNQRVARTDEGGARRSADEAAVRAPYGQQRDALLGQPQLLQLPLGDPAILGDRHLQYRISGPQPEQCCVVEHVERGPAAQHPSD